ncbi:MAG: 3-keto-5-aminohexanoate cleavage protein [Saprospiraceae bacterium]|nr:3-keto-5-aminohexanoate cleavage protein [Saprospiraceae bacterium]
MSDKIIITAALTGVLATRHQSPHIPYTPQEIADEGKRAIDGGASILHIHARQPNGMPAYDVDTYAQIDAAVKAACPDAIINYSTGAIGISNEDRIHHIDALKPDMAALNMGSMNYAIYSRKKKSFHHDHVFANPFRDIRFFLERMQQAGTRPEMECFDTGHIHNATPLIDMGLLTPPFQFSMIMGVLGGIPATTQNLVHQVSQLTPSSHWQLIGIGRKQWAMVMAALSMGGNVRVGLEDNLYLPDGSLSPSNGASVEEAVKLARIAGLQPASPLEARSILSLTKTPQLK